MKSIILFGAGGFGKRAYKKLSREYRIIAFADNNCERRGDLLEKVPIISPEDIKDYSYDFIVISNEFFYMDIAFQLYELGVDHAYRFVHDYINAPEEYSLKWITGKPLYHGIPYKGLDKRIDKAENCHYTKASSDRKRVLVIAYYFPPIGGVQVQRTLEYVKYLPELGYDPIVVTTDKVQEWLQYDAKLMDEIPDNVEIIRIKDEFHYLLEIENDARVRAFEFMCSVLRDQKLVELLKEAEKTTPFYALPDNLVFWACKAFCELDRFVDFNKIDALYSTAPEWSPHLLGYLLKKTYDIPWVADYRDPWVSNDCYIKAFYQHMTEKEVEFDKKLESIIVGEMNHIVVAGGKWTDFFREAYHVPKEKISVITNGYDEKIFSRLSIRTAKNDSFVICHNGQVVNNRTPIPLLVEINELIKLGRIDRDLIKIVFNSYIRDDIKENIEKTDMNQICVFNGKLPFERGLQIAYDADLLLLLSEPGDDAGSYYPAKFYEYLRLGRPILCLAGPDTFQESVLVNTSQGVCIRYEDSTSIRDYVYEAYCSWMNRDNQMPYVNEKTFMFDRRELTRKLSEVLCDCC